MADVVAVTERIHLRTWDEDDEFRFFRLMNTPSVMRWLGGLQTAEEWHAAFMRLKEYERDFGFTFWLMERRSDGEILGFCGLKRANAPGADAIAGEIEIGWRLREDAWGQGYAKEGAIASLDLAFNRFVASRVVAVTAARNRPSQGLMKRIGMVRCEQFDFIDQRFEPDSDVNPQVVFMMEGDAWPAARALAL